MERSQNIDVGLAVLSAVRRDADKPNEQFTLDEIAEVCGCTAERIRQIEKNGLAKVSKRLQAKLGLSGEEFHEECLGRLMGTGNIGKPTTRRLKY